MRMSWRDHAKRHIALMCEQWADTNGYLPDQSMPENEKKRFLAMLRASYPFGERRMLPYKVWCQETRRVREWLTWQKGTPKTWLPKSGKPRVDTETPSMFEEAPGP